MLCNSPFSSLLFSKKQVSIGNIPAQSVPDDFFYLLFLFQTRGVIVELFGSFCNCYQGHAAIISCARACPAVTPLSLVFLPDVTTQPAPSSWMLMLADSLRVKCGLVSKTWLCFCKLFSVFVRGGGGSVFLMLFFFRYSHILCEKNGGRCVR